MLGVMLTLTYLLTGAMLIIAPMKQWLQAHETPSSLAVARLLEEDWVQSGSACENAAHGAWRTLRMDSLALQHFLLVARKARHPAGRVYGLAGVRAVASATVFDSVLAGLAPGLFEDSVPVGMRPDVPPVNVRTADLLPDIVSGRLATVLAASQLQAAC